MTDVGVTALAERRFRHEAVLYTGDDGFLEATLSFVLAAVDGGEPVLVVEPAPRLALLESHLGPAAGGVTFEDVDEVGRNPARLVGLFARFAARHRRRGRWVRGVGEPANPRRSAPELREVELHELVANEAFDPASRIWLRCPYDVATLDPQVLVMATRSHPYVGRAGDPPARAAAITLRAAGLLATPLSAPSPTATVIPFDGAGLSLLRARLAETGRSAGLGEDRVMDLVLAVDELASNSVRHGGGAGVVRAWLEQQALVVEVADKGHLTDPLAGRLPPPPDRPGGRGLWIVNQLADLTQLSTAETGTVARCWFCL